MKRRSLSTANRKGGRQLGGSRLEQGEVAYGWSTCGGEYLLLDMLAGLTIMEMEHGHDLSGWTFLCMLKIWAGIRCLPEVNVHPTLTEALPVFICLSVAAAGPHHHVLVFLQYDVGVVVEIEHWNGVQLGGGAARLGYVLGVHQVHLEIMRKTFSLFMCHKSPTPSFYYQKK